MKDALKKLKEFHLVLSELTEDGQQQTMNIITKKRYVLTGDDQALVRVPGQITQSIDGGSMHAVVAASSVARVLLQAREELMELLNDVMQAEHEEIRDIALEVNEECGVHEYVEDDPYSSILDQLAASAQQSREDDEEMEAVEDEEKEPVPQTIGELIQLQMAKMEEAGIGCTCKHCK